MLEDLESNSEVVRNNLQAVDQTPDEAIKNIDNSESFDVTPENYSEVSSELDTEVEAQTRVPAQIGNATTNFLSGDTQYAAASKDNVKEIDNVDSRWTYWKNKSLNIPDNNRRIAELSNKKISMGTLSEEEEDEVEILTTENEEMMMRKPEEIGDIEELATDVTQGVGDIVRMYTENLGTIAAITGTTTLAGGALGTVIPGVGTAAGASAGFFKGVTASSIFVGAKDAYEQTTGLMYNGLIRAKDKAGKPLDISHERASNISRGVGVLSGVLGGLAGKALSSNNPIMKSFSSPKQAIKMILKNPKMLARMSALGGIAATALSEGAEEGLQEFIQIVGEKFAEIGEDDESFGNSLDNIVEAFGSSVNAETGKQVLRAATVGGLTGATFQGIQTPLAMKSLETKFANEQKLNKERTETLEFQNTLLSIEEDFRKAKENGFKDKVKHKAIDSIYDFLDVNKTLNFDAEALEQFATTPEKTAALGKLVELQEINETYADLNIDPQIDTAEMHKAGIITEFPDVTEYTRPNELGETPAQIKERSKAHAEKVTQTDARVKELLGGLADDDKITPEIAEEFERLRKEVKDVQPFDDEFDYLDSATFVEIEGVISKVEAEQLNSDMLAVKLEVGQELKDEANSEFDVASNKIIKDISGKELKEQIKYYESNFLVIDKFKSKLEISDVDKATVANHKKKGFSPSAIDPSTLSEDLKEIYLNDKNLKKRKAFVEGGVHMEEAAAMNGVEDGAKLLEILAKTPSKTNVKKLKAQQKISIESRVGQLTKPARKSKVDAAFSKVSTIYKKQLDIMRTKEWKTLKRGIIKVSKTPLNVKEMQVKASNMIDSLTLKDVNPNKFLQGERRSKTLSTKNMVDGKPEQAYANLEKAYLNNELRREATKAKNKIEANKNFWKKTNSPTIQNSLRKAGLTDAMRELTDLLRLDGNDKNIKSIEKFNEYVLRETSKGNYVSKIPENLQDVRKSIKDLTVEEYEVITNAGKTLVDKARLKNKVLGHIELKDKVLSQDELSENIATELESHPDFDVEKTKSTYEATESVFQTALGKVSSFVASINNVQSIVKHLNNEKISGFFSELISTPLNNARLDKLMRIQKLKGQMDKVVNLHYGDKDKFKVAQSEFVTINEFADIDGLGDAVGRIRKFDLFVLQAYRGDSDYFKDLENFSYSDGTRLSLPEIEAILEQHISDSEAVFVQNFFINPFKEYTQESLDLHERTTGVRPEAIAARQFVHKGKVVEGGYYPGKRKATSDDVKAAKDQQALENKGISAKEADDLRYFQNFRAAEFTKQDRMQQRTGSKRTLDIDFQNVFNFHEEIAHDLSHREVTGEVIDVLTNGKNVKSLKSVLGETKYDILLNSVKDVASKTSERDNSLFKIDGILDNVVNKLNSFHAISVLGYSTKSMLTQPASLFTTMMALGPKSIVPLAKNTAKGVTLLGADILGKGFNATFGSRLKHFSDNPSMYEGMENAAAKFNPDVEFEQDGVDDSVIKTFKGEFTNVSGKDKSKMYHRLKNLEEKVMVELAFEGLRQFDKTIRMITTLSIADQFNAGKVEGFSSERIAAMTPDQRDTNLKNIVQEVTRSTLTASSILDKSSLEKSKPGKAFVRYFTDVRSMLNTVFSQGRKIRSSYKQGDYRQTVNQAAWLLVSTNLMKGYLSLLQKDEKEEFDILNEVKDFFLSPVDLLTESIPGVSSINYAINSNSSFKQVSLPSLKVASDIAKAIASLPELFSEKGLSKYNRQAVVHSLGYATGGKPTKVLNGLIDWAASEEGDSFDGSMVIHSNIFELKDMLNSYLKNDDLPEVTKEVLRERLNELPQDEISVEGLVDEYAQETYALALSGDDWKKVNPDTGAAGVYQFTEERWNELIATEPELGLTESGRFEKDLTEQDKAMEFSLRENAAALHNYGFEVTQENLMGAHVLGIDEYMEIMSHSDNTKLSKILGKSSNEAPFDKFKTVKSVKSYLNRLVTS